MTQDLFIRNYKTGLQWSATKSDEASVQRVSAYQRLKGPGQGLEPTAVSCASLYQEADGSGMEH